MDIDIVFSLSLSRGFLLFVLSSYLSLAFSSHLKNVSATWIGLCFLYGRQDQMSEIKKREIKWKKGLYVVISAP